MTYSKRKDTFTGKWVLEKEDNGKVERIATFSNEQEPLFCRVIAALNERRIDVC